MTVNKSTQALYEEYKSITQKAADLQYAGAVLGWDQEVYMPAKGFDRRSQQMATLAAMAHEMVTAADYGNLLHELAGRGDMNEAEQANVRLSLEDYEKNKKLPTDFVEALTRQTGISFNAWLIARNKNDYSLYAAELQNMIALKKKQTLLYGYEAHPYDSLLDDYEKRATVTLLDNVFATVKQELPALLAKIKAAPQVNDDFFLHHYPKQQQWDFSIDVLKTMGYDFEAGRQDISEHPFTTSFSSHDVRVTTRVDENNFTSLLWSSIHEGGHALYEQGLPDEQYGLPLCAAASLSIHESQSRLWENCIGRSYNAWKFFYPKLQSYFPSQLAGIPLADFYKGMNKVEPSFIRTEADEVTYHFHVLIRYEIEKALISGDLDVKDLRDTWNALYKKYLSLEVPDDKRGILQDVHWSHGMFGYFPTYSLGSFYAAQFFAHAEKNIPGLHTQTESGDYAPLLGWLRENVHRHGRRYRSEELCRNITGEGLDFNYFMKYAEKKFAGVYEI